MASVFDGGVFDSGVFDTGGIEITPSPVVVEVFLPPPAVTFPQELTPAPIVVEVVLPAVSLAAPIGLAPSPVVVEVVLPAPDVAYPLGIEPSPLVVEVVVNAVNVRIPTVRFVHDVRLYHAYAHSPWSPRHRLAEFSTAHNADRGWVSMDTGRAALYISVRDPAIRHAVKGNLLVIEGPGMPAWAGTIVTDEEDDRSGVLQLSAVSLEELLNARTTHQNEEYRDSIGGAAMLRSVVSGANARNPTGILLPSVFEFAPEVDDFQVGAESVREALDEYCGRNNYEWWVDVQVSPRWVKASLRLGYRQGIDYSASLHVYQGTHCSGIYKSDLSQTKAVSTSIGDFGAELRDRNSVTRYGTIGGVDVDFGSAVIDGANVGISRRIASSPPGLRTEDLDFEVMTGSTGELNRKAGRGQDRPLASVEMFNLTFFNRTVDKTKLRIGNSFTYHGRLKGQPFSRVCRIASMQADEELGVTPAVVEVPL